MDTRKKNLAILGSYSSTPEESEIARELGAHLANMNLNILSGGQKKGVMYDLCKGVFEHRISATTGATLVGILPSTDFSQANEFLDIAIPTGSGLQQNSVLPLSADVVLAIGGSAGTLTEISFAWQYKKPIGLLGTTGWAQRLANQKLDSRREDDMPHFISVKDAIDWISGVLFRVA